MLLDNLMGLVNGVELISSQRLLVKQVIMTG